MTPPGSTGLSLARPSAVVGVGQSDDRFLESRFVVAALGRSGASWMKEVVEALRVKTKAIPVDIGVRVELPARGYCA